MKMAVIKSLMPEDVIPHLCSGGCCDTFVRIRKGKNYEQGEAKS